MTVSLKLVLLIAGYVNVMLFSVYWFCLLSVDDLRCFSYWRLCCTCLFLLGIWAVHFSLCPDVWSSLLSSLKTEVHTHAWNGNASALNNSSNKGIFCNFHTFLSRSEPFNSAKAITKVFLKHYSDFKICGDGVFQWWTGVTVTFSLSLSFAWVVFLGPITWSRFRWIARCVST